LGTAKKICKKGNSAKASAATDTDNEAVS